MGSNNGMKERAGLETKKTAWTGLETRRFCFPAPFAHVSLWGGHSVALILKFPWDSARTSSTPGPGGSKNLLSVQLEDKLFFW